MPMWVVKICDPDGYRDRDECYGIFDTQTHAAEWAVREVPKHITWHSHHLRTLDMYNRSDWEVRLPDFLASIPHKRGMM